MLCDRGPRGLWIVIELFEHVAGFSREFDRSERDHHVEFDGRNVRRVERRRRLQAQAGHEVERRRGRRRRVELDFGLGIGFERRGGARGRLGFKRWVGLNWWVWLSRCLWLNRIERRPWLYRRRGVDGVLRQSRHIRASGDRQ